MREVDTSGIVGESCSAGIFSLRGEVDGLGVSFRVGAERTC